MSGRVDPFLQSVDRYAENQTKGRVNWPKNHNTDQATERPTDRWPNNCFRANNPEMPEKLFVQRAAHWLQRLSSNAHLGRLLCVPPLYGKLQPFCGLWHVFSHMVFFSVKSELYRYLGNSTEPASMHHYGPTKLVRELWLERRYNSVCRGG